MRIWFTLSENSIDGIPLIRERTTSASENSKSPSSWKTSVVAARRPVPNDLSFHVKGFPMVGAASITISKSPSFSLMRTCFVNRFTIIAYWRFLIYFDFYIIKIIKLSESNIKPNRFNILFTPKSHQNQIRFNKKRNQIKSIQFCLN